MNPGEIIPMSEINLDIDEMVDKIYIGPQGELLQRIHNFNQTFGDGTDIIRITSKFRFRPGTYDKIKTAYTKYALKFNMKPRGIYSLRDRIQQYSQWRGRQFWNYACEIESRMWQQRHRDNNWVDNTELIAEKWNEEKNAFISKQEEFNSQHPESNLVIGLPQYSVNDSEQWSNMKVWTYLSIKDIVITVLTGVDEVIGVIPWGDIDLKWSFNFFGYLNAACRGDSLNGYTGLGNPSAKLSAIYKNASHPYVSRRYNYDRSADGWIGSTCTGDMDSNIRTAVKSKDYDALHVLCTNWLTRYHIPNTNPLNRIHSCFYGFPEGAHTKLMTLRRNDGRIRSDSFNPRDYMQNCSWKSVKSSEMENSINERGVSTRIDDTESENACDNCQFKSDYSYAIDDGSVMTYDACSFPKIMEYNDPTTEEECQWEAGILLLMCRNLLQNANGSQHMLGNEGLFPVPQDNNMVKDLIDPNAELDNVLECNPDINLEYFWWKTRTRYPGSQLDVLDFIFKTRLWEEIMDELLYMYYGPEEERIDEDQDAVYAFRDEHETYSIDQLQAMLSREREGRNVSDVGISENMTPEERVIAWAARNGSAINIGESR